MTTKQKIIPKGWQIKRFGDLVNICTGKKDANAQVVGGGYPFFTCAQSVSEIDNYTFDTEAVIVAGNGDFSVKYYKGKFDAYQRTYVIEAKNNLIPIFLYYGIQYALPKITSGARGSTIQYLKMGDFTEFQFLVPPAQEQKKIAEILLTVDLEIKKTDEIILKTEKLKKGLMQKLFTKGIGHKKLKIKDISEVTSSKRVTVSDYVDEGIPFYRSTEIIKKSKNIPLTNLLYISAEKFNFFKDRFGAPEKGDILITAVGTIGDVYMVQNEVFYFKDGNTIWVRKIKDSVLPEYLRMMLGSNFYREKLNNIAGGSSQKALTIQKLENVEAPVPSISEQKRLIEVISSVENKTKVYTQTKNNLNQLKKGLVRDLLSGKVRTK